MNLFEWLKGKFSRDKPMNLFRFGTPFFFGRTKSGQNVNDITAMQTSAVYACVRILAESIASLPLNIYQYTDSGKVKATDHPLYFLLHDSPNSEMTSFAFRESKMVDLLLRGNGYSRINRKNGGKIASLDFLSASRVTVNQDDDGKTYYLYTPTNAERLKNKESGQVRLEQYEVLHVHGLGFDGLVGYSPIAMMKNAVGTTLAVEEFGASFFENGARLSGVLEHPGIIKDTSKVRESWQKTYGGSENVGKVAILEEGMKYQQIGIPPEDAQFLETRKFQIEEIARIFRVPLHLIGDLEHATFSNIEQQSLEYVKYTLNAWIVRWEQAMNKSLLLPEERKKYFIKFNVDGLLRGDYQSRVEGYCKLIQNGVMSVNDVRELEDMNKIPAELGGDLHIVNGNFIKLQDAGIYANKGGDKK